MTLLFIIHILICVFLVVVILIQPGKSDAGIGFGSSSQSIFGSRGAGNFLTKTTSVCAIIFLVTSFFLTRSRIVEYNQSVIKEESTPADKTKPADKKAVPPAATKETKPGTPTEKQPGGLTVPSPAPEGGQKKK